MFKSSKQTDESLTPLQIMEKYLKPLMESSLISGDFKTAPTEPLIHVWAILKFVNERIDATLKEIRAELLDRAEARGRLTDKGGYRIGVEGNEIIKEKRVSPLPPEKDIKELLGEHNIDVKEAFSKVTKMKLDASKIQMLVDLGKLRPTEVNALKKVTWALRVKESEELAEAIESALGDLQEEEEELLIVERKKRTRATGARK